MHFALGVGVLLADLWSKSVVANRPIWQEGRIGVVRFRFVPHRERSYERTGARLALVTIWTVALLCALVLYRWTAWFHSPASLAGLGLLFGGSAGNLLDILRRRYVVDFIDLGWWPVFNLADLAIVTGVSTALLG
jgi:signal peptidase II